MRDAGTVADERLLVGPETLDDAGIVALGDGGGAPALVQTADFFPPVVDDPYYYGAIAAANAISDVYAMGGSPLCALTIASFPKGFPRETLTEILRGGFDKVREAGAVVAGGHTVEGELTFGFAVTGTVDPAVATSNAGARAGDVLYLTKALGMGALTTGAKRGVIDFEALRPAAEQMARLNRAAAEAMMAAGARACTDITGFGLLGHASNIAAASGVTLTFSAERLPVFEGAVELARDGVLSGASRRGRELLAERVRIDPAVEGARADLFFDAETSGGLLVAVPAERAGVLEAGLEERGEPVLRVGEVVARGDVEIEVRA